MSDKFVGRCARGCCPSPAEHFKSLRFMQSGQGSVHDRDRKLAKDLEAYRRLRQNGVQPKNIDGSAWLESTSETKAMVELRTPPRETYASPGF